MGGSHSKRDQGFNPNQWEEIASPKNHQNSQCTVVKNRITGELLDRYQMQFPNEKEYNRYMDSVEYRRDEENIVRVVHYEPKIVKQFCGSSYTLYVYLQHCKSRLSQFQDIPSPDNLYCALAMLEGYEKLYRKVGRFYVSQNQVIIDQQGKIRVWLNADFSQNQAEDLRPNVTSLSNKNQEYNMVNDIMNILFENSDESDDPHQIKFRDFYEREKISHDQKVGFAEARNIIYEYARMNHIDIPEVFTSVLSIYEQEDVNEGRHGHENQSLRRQVYLDQEDRLHSNQRIQSRVGASPLGYQAVNSVVNHNFSPANPNPYVSTRTFAKDSSNTTFGHPVYSSSRTPVIFNGSVAPSFSNQVSARPGLPTINSVPVPRGYNPTPIVQQPPRSGNYSFTIRPNNISINGASRTVSNSPIKIPPPPAYRPATYTPTTTGIRIPPPPSTFAPHPNSILLPNEGIRRVESQPERFGAQQITQTNQNSKKIELGEQQLQIQKNLILKNNAYSDQYVNEANVIRDLSELHKIQQEQRSKRSNLEEDNSRNVSINAREKQQVIGMGNYENHFNEESSGQIIKESQKEIEEMRKNKNQREYQEGYEGFEEEQNLFREEIREVNNVKQQNYSPIITATTSNSNFRSQPIQVGQKITFNNQTNPVYVRQQSQPLSPQPPRYVNGFNKPPLPPQLQSYTSYNSLNTYSQSPKNIPNSPSKRQIYYTLSNEIELDPQIANDLALLAQS